MSFLSPATLVNTPLSAASPELVRRRRFAVWTVTLLLILGTMLMYNPAVHGSFLVYDDPDYVTMNPHILQGLSPSNISWAFSSLTQGHWHPVTSISHMVDVELFKLNPMGHHLSSVFIHGINVVLIFLLLVSVTGQLWRSAMTGALFALHPLNVESVAWISERKNLLCTLFMILALWAYKWYVKKPNIRHYLWIVLFFALALMAKSMVVTFPFLLLMFDYWPLQRGFPSNGEEQPGWPVVRKLRMLVMEKIVLFGMAAATAVLAFYTQRAGGTVSASLPLRFRLENAIYSYVLYLVKGFWPASLSAFYPHPQGSLALWKVIAAACVLVAITITVVRYRERHYLVVGWFWYLVAMLPVVGVIQAGRQAMADRYAYIPLLGIFFMVVWLLADLMGNARVPRLAIASSAAAVLAMCGYLGYRQAGYWNNNITLFSHALEVTTNNEVAELNLGAALVDAGRPDSALPHLVAAARLEPASSKAHYWLGNALQHQGRLAEAAREYQVALRYPAETDLQASVYNNLGVILLVAKDLAHARLAFDRAISLNAREQNSFLGRGAIEYQEGNLNAARADYSRATEISPSPLAFYWLGRIWEEQNDPNQASIAYRAALQLAPGMTDAQTHLAAIQQHAK